MQKIGKYHVEQKLGQGGMGIVYKCRDSETGELAAVKVLPQQLAGDAVFLQRFKREVMTLRRLDHPNIVRIFDQGEAEGAFYYAMEYVEGTTLESVLDKNEKMAPPRAMGIVRGCAEALEHSHSLGVVHRDIKPANVMLTKDDSVKLMDFGIAKVLDATRMTATQGVLGTVEYMSPEQSQGRHVDARSDFYSLGALLYQCLTTRLPITGGNPTEIIMKLRTHQIDPPDSWVPGLPRNLSRFVMRLLNKDPLKRPESARELLRELARIEHQIESGVTGHGPSVGEERVLAADSTPTVPIWQNRWFLICAALVLVVGAYLLWGRQPPADDDTPPPPPPNQDSDWGSPAAGHLGRARRARERKQYAYATDLCLLIIKHFPDTPQAEDAQKELLNIEQAKVEDAKEEAEEEAQSPEDEAPGKEGSN